MGKLVGGSLGIPFGPVGIAIGVLLGHQFDLGLTGVLPGSAATARHAFFTTTFEIMGHIAKADGRVSEDEIQTARRIMHGMQLTPEQVQVAIDHFTLGKQASYPLKQKLEDLLTRTGHRRELARSFLQIQLQAMLGSGDVAQSKRALLWRIAQQLGVDRVELAQIEASLRGREQSSARGVQTLDLGSAYRTLGIAKDASDREIKTAYRRMMNLHHPDKLKSKGLPESMMAVAEERTQQIRAAYDRVRAARGFR